MPDIRAEILAQARARQERVYRLDPPPSASDGTIDCSLLVLEVAAAAGVPLPAGVRTAEEIRQATVPIAFSDVLPGDLLFFEGTYDAAGPAGPDGRIGSHIGISLGAGTKRMIDAHARSGPDVAETDISSDYWQQRIFEARRLPGLVTAAPVEQLRGIDVASYQGNPDWDAVAASGISFAITKVSEDEDYLNPTFARNWREIARVGLVRGAYHYARPESAADAIEEADHFVGRIEGAGGVAPGDLLALDLESGAGDLGQWALDFVRRVEARTGVKPLIYTGAWFSDPHELDLKAELAKYPLWLAAYQATMPAVPAPWDRIAIWQHSSTGRVDGIAGDVDLNVFNGTREQLLALGKGGSVEQPTTDPRDEQIAGLLTAVAHLADVVVPKAASAAAQRDEALAEAQRVREQFVGPRPAA